jgi:ribosomal protein L40E
MEKYMPIIIPILMTMAILLYRLNENSTNSSNTSNQMSYTGKPKAQFVGQMKRCGYCSARVPLDAQACLQCPDKMPTFRWESESDAHKPPEPKLDEPKSLEFKLKEIDRLRESGVITEIEYQTKRKAILESY